MTTHIVTVRSAYHLREGYGHSHNKFDWRFGSVESSEPSNHPLLVAASHLLANGLASPDDKIEMVHDGDSFVSLRATVGGAAILAAKRAKKS